MKKTFHHHWYGMQTQGRIQRLSYCLEQSPVSKTLVQSNTIPGSRMSHSILAYSSRINLTNYHRVGIVYDWAIELYKEYIYLIEIFAIFQSVDIIVTLKLINLFHSLALIFIFILIIFIFLEQSTAFTIGRLCIARQSVSKIFGLISGTMLSSNSSTALTPSTSSKENGDLESKPRSCLIWKTKPNLQVLALASFSGINITDTNINICGNLSKDYLLKWLLPI